MSSRPHNSNWAVRLARRTRISKKPAVTVVDHCYTCVPLLLPPPLLVIEPAGKSVSPDYATPTFAVEDHPRLDPPPPKYWT
ncbi:hypothetical protein ACVOMS_21230 [Bradyrhizobium guangxiense]